MSDLDTHPTVRECGGRDDVSAAPVRELIPGREAHIGGSSAVRRVLPTLGRRMVGPWCFLDHYGPDDISARDGMQVAPHPHIGLQTVSWLREGEILHRDSVGSLATVLPGSLGLMTSGRGIAHSEESPVPHPAMLHGVQLWVALPDADRDTDPCFDLHTELPTFEARGLRGTVIMGEVDGSASPGRAYSPIAGAELALDADADVRLPLERDFEYAVVATGPGAVVDDVPLPVGSLLYLGCGRDDLRVRTDSASDLILVGGEPFAEKIVMWWNFVGRSHDEIVRARAQWQAEERFGEVHGYHAPRLAAPEMPATPLKPRGRAR
ncbi:pirin family protein [Yinghuangia sp. ASG 101]|uniref:pirin family protein n=1 Tax=Yinghuangia sp. ASG 101 TaxID=2896848 RepID=UPI001E57EFA2|nr:pirin family protein [Yinghuangia sp. ASG 101]UGQ09947.1 pirin family protein [Yinghuangia sp. ASG 101]